MLLKNIKFKSLAFISILLFPLMTWAGPGAYISGEAGGIAAETNSFPGFGGGFSGRVALGYLWGDCNFNYGLESGLLVYPNVSADNSFFLKSNITVDGYDIDLLGVLKYTFNNGFVLFAKGGGAYVHQRATTTTPELAFLGQAQVSNTQSTIAPEIAAGLGYQFTPHFETDLTVASVFAGSPSTTNPNKTLGGTSRLMLGLTYHFG